VPPWERAEVISAQQDIFWKNSGALRCGSERDCELPRRLASVPSELIDLARRGLHMKNGAVIETLLNGCVDYVRVSGADCVDAALARLAIVEQQVLQAGTGTL
jgi:hypothetical protein